MKPLELSHLRLSEAGKVMDAYAEQVQRRRTAFLAAGEGRRRGQASARFAEACAQHEAARAAYRAAVNNHLSLLAKKESI